jgi:hypothetical protein
VREELLEAEAVEEQGAEPGDSAAEVRHLPTPAGAREVAPLRGEVGTVAAAAAGGIVAGMATVAVMRVARAASAPRKRSVRRSRKDSLPGVVASRSFLIDVHLLDR